ncbi:DnaA regulatory inactivator Hda [Pseudomonadota bacterium]
MSEPNSMQQMALGMWLRESATFDNYVLAENALAVEAVRQACAGGAERFVYLWGGDGVGKSHLMQAACHSMTAQAASAVYLPLAEPGLAPEILDGLEQVALVAVDNLDAIVGQRAWETALFHLYNRMRDQGHGVLLFASSHPLASLEISLPDLLSRLAWGLVFQLHTLSDADKLAALRQRADQRGFELSEEVGRYLLRHYQRDMSALFELLTTLDQRSLAEQRRLTIPFVKEIIGN